jgi:hypothetical protein
MFVSQLQNIIFGLELNTTVCEPYTLYILFAWTEQELFLFELY